MPQKPPQDCSSGIDEAFNSPEKQPEGRDARRAAIMEAWRNSADAHTFITSLRKQGYYLARGDKQSYVVVDLYGNTHSLARQIDGVRPNEIKAKFADVFPEELPDIQTARNQAKLQQTDQLSSLQESEPTGPVRAFAPYALLIVAVFLAYSNVYHNEFLYDDLFLITGNKFLTSWHYVGRLFVTNAEQGHGSHGPFYRPLQLLLYMFIYQTAGPSTVAFHLLNVSLHALNACLLYTLGVTMGFQRVAVMLAALLWGVHPVHTQAVTYMSGTAELLYSVFLIGGILVLVPGFSPRRVLAACFLFVLALLSKEASVVFPLLVMGLLFYQSENRWSPKTYLKTWPFWLLVGFYFLARETVLNFNGFFEAYKDDLTPKVAIWGRFCTFVATLPTYLRLLLWPTGLHIERLPPIYTSLWTSQVMAGLAILAALFAGILRNLGRRATPLAWGILWAGALFIPVSGILVPNDALISENWLYLPTAGFALGLGESLGRLSMSIRTRHLRPVLAGLVVLIAGLFGVMTFEQNRVWRDPVTFYLHILACGEDTIMTRLNLGVTYLNKGQYEAAIRQFRYMLAYRDSFAPAHYNFAEALLGLDQSQPSITEAIKHLQRTIDLDPDYYRAYDQLAEIYIALGDHTKESECRAKSAAIKHKLGID
jgi:tetratricopeptide (TPR) repeat protein